MDTINLEVHKNYQDGNGTLLTIESIIIQITPDGAINTVIVTFAADEMAWYHLPDDNDKVKTWRPV